MRADRPGEAPAPGRVKTRLAATLGAERACALYRAFVLTSPSVSKRCRTTSHWAYWPATAPFAALLLGHAAGHSEGRTLGERMANAIAECGHPAVVIGADAPHVPAARLTEAADALAADADLVLGPGGRRRLLPDRLRAPTPAVFSGVAWGTSRVLAETLAHARGLRRFSSSPASTSTRRPISPASRTSSLVETWRCPGRRPCSASPRSALDSASRPDGHSP
jgi:glycosyltransferase A (GT-A) superfamily protein (DUF2064 family)